MRKVYIAITAWIIIVAIVVVVLRRLPHTIPFETVSGIEFWNAGTGNWQSNVNIMSDGTFTAQGHDLDMGINGEGYPGGTMWMMDGGGNNICKFYSISSLQAEVEKLSDDGFLEKYRCKKEDVIAKIGMLVLVGKDDYGIMAGEEYKDLDMILSSIKFKVEVVSR